MLSKLLKLVKQNTMQRAYKLLNLANWTRMNFYICKLQSLILQNLITKKNR